MSPPPRRAVTLDDVARHVGVSARTVSRVVNDEGGCTEATRLRILAAIDELGYRPNLMARGLIRRHSDTVGLINLEMLDPFFPEVADGVERAVREDGQTLFLANTSGDRERQRRALTSLLGHGVDGAIVFPTKDGIDDLIDFAGKGLPIVVVNVPVEGHRITSVTAEIRSGAELAVGHLIAGGRRRIIALIDETARHNSTPSRREAGYRATLAAAGRTGPDDQLVIEIPNSLEGGRIGIDRAFALPDPPDAVFAYNDLIAIGALQRALELGIRIPDDLAIVGFDDIMMCEAMTPKLTSVRIDRDRLGRVAVESLRALIDDGTAPTRHLAVELIVRDSTGWTDV